MLLILSVLNLHWKGRELGCMQFLSFSSISNEFSNPNGASRLMRDYIKSAIKVTTDTLRKDMFLKFSQARVGFKEVELVAEHLMKQHKSSDNTRNEKYEIVKDVMKHKQKDALKCLRKSRDELYKSNITLSKTVRKGTLAREAFMDV